MRPFDYPITFRWTSEFRRPPDSEPLLSHEDAERLARLIDWGGWPFPVVLDDCGRVVAGARRLEAARLFGELAPVPTVRLRDLTPSGLDVCEAADARLAARLDWGGPLLAADRALLARFRGAAEGGHDTSPTCTSARPPAAPPAPSTVTKPGDVWRLGRHVLMCADARTARIAQLVDEEADAVFFDPPQNLFGELPAQAYANGLNRLAIASRTALRPGGFLFAAFDWRNLGRWLAVCGPLRLVPRDLAVWVGAHGPAGALYQAGHKLISCARFGHVPHINNVAVTGAGKACTNVMQAAADKGAPTSLPAVLVARLIEDATPAGGLVADVCAGAGATLIAAERTGRRAALIELRPTRCDAIIKRFADETGEIARHGETGAVFDAAAHDA